MDNRVSSYEGCLLGLAIGDVLGCAVDKLTVQEIVERYGPNGLLGYDLQSDVAEVSSYTQLPAFLCAGLLVGLTRGRTDAYLRCIAASLREWAYCQQARRAPDRSLCWLSQLPQFRRRLCMDTRMLDTLNREALGTPEAPVNNFVSCGAITAPVAVALFFDAARMEPQHIGTLGTQTVAMLCGDPEAFLCGAFLSYSIAGILQEPERPLQEQFDNASRIVCAQFGEKFPQAKSLAAGFQKVVAMTRDPERMPREAMEELGCSTAYSCTLGAVYASLVHAGSIDEALITAVNHSGRSAAVGALTGAILGAKLGAENLPEFYLEGLDTAPILRELARDLTEGSPTSGIFDDSWDQKYAQGRPVNQ